MVAGTAGLDDARYLARAPERVLVIRTADPAPAPRRRLRRRKPADASPGSAVPPPPVSSLTVIWTSPLGTAAEADAWLEGLRADPEAALERIAEATALVNRAVHARRTADLDPHLPDVSPEHALAVRVGYGDGDRVADGRWERAVEVPRGERRRRGEVLRPQEGIAAVLSGERPADPAVALLLRARADLDAGRAREAALQLRLGVETLLTERPSEGEPAGREAADLRELADRRAGVAEAAAEARSGEASPERREEVARALEICERVLRRRAAGGGR